MTTGAVSLYRFDGVPVELDECPARARCTLFVRFFAQSFQQSCELVLAANKPIELLHDGAPISSSQQTQRALAATGLDPQPPLITFAPSPSQTPRRQACDQLS